MTEQPTPPEPQRRHRAHPSLFVQRPFTLFLLPQSILGHMALWGLGGDWKRGERTPIFLLPLLHRADQLPHPLLAYLYVFLYTSSAASVASLEISAASGGLACGTMGTVARVELQLGRRPNSSLCIFCARTESL
jgi:hypothetical protein